MWVISCPLMTWPFRHATTLVSQTFGRLLNCHNNPGIFIIFTDEIKKPKNVITVPFSLSNFAVFVPEVDSTVAIRPAHFAIAADRASRLGIMHFVTMWCAYKHTVYILLISQLRSLTTMYSFMLLWNKHAPHHFILGHWSFRTSGQVGSCHYWSILLY